MLQDVLHEEEIDESETLQKFKEFQHAAENESGMKIKGGEYLSEEFESHMKECGIRAESTAAYSPQQNGVAERLNRTLVEAARSMLNHARLPNVFWADAISTATYLRNRMITSSLKSGKTPYHMWYGEKPNLEHVRMCSIHVPDVQRKKLDKKARKLRLIGYTDTAGNYRAEMLRSS